MTRNFFIWIAVIVICSLSSCRQNDASQEFTQAEKALIYSFADTLPVSEREDISEENVSGVPQGTMRVLTINDSSDLNILRSESGDLSPEALLSDDFSTLAALMLATVQHPSQDGVGIAAPQVGLNRRIVAVQRFDKEGEPFEVYPNIRLVWASDSTAYGMEGCLSIPGRNGKVLRSQEVVIEYTDLESLKAQSGKPYLRRRQNAIPTLRDTVKGFTAVIFQHEIDHLRGRLYIDLL